MQVQHQRSNRLDEGPFWLMCREEDKREEPKWELDHLQRPTKFVSEFLANFKARVLNERRESGYCLGLRREGKEQFQKVSAPAKAGQAQ